MNPFIEKLLEDDFIWGAITSHLPSKLSRSKTDFMNINCPMCVLKGESPDTRQRCGIKRDSDGIGISCFNCGFKTLWKNGDLLSKNLKSFLKELGVGEREISQLNHRAFQLSRVIGDSNTTVVHRDTRFNPQFPTVVLPPDTLTLMEWAEAGLDDPDFIQVVEYAASRGVEITEKAMWCPEPKWKNRLIIPFEFRGEIVGLTGRLVIPATDENPKYMSEVPTDYLYNSDVMTQRDRKYLIMPEGVLDAVAIDGISPLGAKLSPRQATWIKDSGKTTIVVPDRDKSGQRLIDSALEHGWRVAFPRLSVGGNNWWEIDCKDCAEAVKRYGRLYTLRSIIQTSTISRMEIEIRRKWLIQQ